MLVGAEELAGIKNSLPLGVFSISIFSSGLDMIHRSRDQFRSASFKLSRTYLQCVAREFVASALGESDTDALAGRPVNTNFSGLRLGDKGQ